MHANPQRTVATGSGGPARWPRRGAGVMAALVLSLGACGGDDATPTPGAEPADAAEVEPTGDASVPGNDADDASTSAELHPLLAALPLPPGFEVPFPAQEHGADIDERETVIQHITVMMPIDEFARFWLTELPRAGFTIVDRGAPWAVTEADIVPDLEVWIYAETPDGFPAQLILKPQGDRTGININLYRAGDD